MISCAPTAAMRSKMPSALRRGVALDAVERAKMRIRAHLPLPLRGQLQQAREFQVDSRGHSGHGFGALLVALRMSDDYPAARDGVFA